MVITSSGNHWQAIRRGPSRQALHESSLVLTALHIEHEILQDDFDWCLVVPEQQAREAIAQLERYQLENRHQPQRPSHQPVDNGWLGVLGFLLVIWALPSIEGLLLLGWQWREIGLLDTSAVSVGEWWRSITALTLHADLAHLLGNSIFGAVFGLMVGRYLGSGLGWLLILFSGAFGNLLNAALRPDELTSIGASTATFAAVAICSGCVWRRGYFNSDNWRRALAPLFGGVTLLIFTGIGDARTDIVAHFTGFGTGLALGIFAAPLDLDRLGRLGQQICGALALALVVLSWTLAGLAGSQ